MRQETDSSAAASERARGDAHPYSWRRFLLYFLHLGALGFGGPIALAGHMQHELLEDRGWIETAWVWSFHAARGRHSHCYVCIYMIQLAMTCRPMLFAMVVGGVFGARIGVAGAQAPR